MSTTSISIRNSIVIMTIYVESFNYETVTLVINQSDLSTPITLNVNTYDRIGIIKQRILENTQYKDKLCLVNYLDRSLDDERTLCDYNTHAGLTILAKKFC